MQWRPIHAIGFVVCEAAQSHTGPGTAGTAWISRESEAHPFSVFFCDGRTKLSDTCSSLDRARWIAEEFAEAAAQLAATPAPPIKITL